MFSRLWFGSKNISNTYLKTICMTLKSLTVSKDFKKIIWVTWFWSCLMANRGIRKHPVLFLDVFLFLTRSPYNSFLMQWVHWKPNSETKQWFLFFFWSVWETFMLQLVTQTDSGYNERVVWGRSLEWSLLSSGKILPLSYHTGQECVCVCVCVCAGCFLYMYVCVLLRCVFVLVCVCVTVQPCEEVSHFSAHGRLPDISNL